VNLKKTLYAVICIFLFALFSCRAFKETASEEKIKKAEHSRKPSTEFQKSINCDSEQKLSALTGFLVGPKALAHYSKNLSEPLLRPFTSDGCSVSPDGIPLTSQSEAWSECCIKHDISYWVGGSKQKKTQADARLQKCIANKGFPKIGKIFKSFVRQFGVPNSTQTFRWGYGWNSKRPYAALTEKDELQIKNLYGVDSSQLEKTLLSIGFPLVRTCDNYDPIFNGISREEKAIYASLNEKMTTDDSIEWAKWDYFNQDKREFLIKLRGCSETLVASFQKNSQDQIEISGNCP
jgi:hypothetical protein